MRPLVENILPVQAAATVNTAAVPTQQLFAVSAQLTATGSAAGTLIIEASNDELTSPAQTPTNWSAIPSATVTISGAGAYLIPKTDLCYAYIRFSYTNSGTGTISINFKALGV